MAEGQDHYLGSMIPEERSTFPLFEQEMLDRVKRDLIRAEDHMEPYHTRWKEQAALYFNANQYDTLRKMNLFPMPMTQELTDQLVAQLRDKLFYANRPCTVVGVEETDKADADAKQEMIDWQDFKLDVPTAIGQFIRDAAIMDICVAKVDYEERRKKVWQDVQEEVDAPELQTGVHRMIGYMPKKQIMVKKKIEVEAYKGAVYTRVDPMDIYWGPDKERIDDEFPIMMKTAVTKDFYESQPYFFNIDQIDTESGMGANDLSSKERMEMTGQKSADNYTEKEHVYVEWQGQVNKVKLLAWRQEAGRLDEEGEDFESLDPNEKVWCIVGVDNGRVVVRLEEQAHDIGRPNYIIGTLQKQENSLIGIGPVQKSMPSHKATEILMGMFIANLKQSVDRKWIINPSSITNISGPINKPGQIIEVNGNVRDTAMVIDQPALSQDLYQGLAMLRKWMLDAFGLQDITTGQGDPEAETLGEATMTEAYSSLRLRDYLKTFEDTFIQPFYEMRNQINEEMLDAEYIYAIIGDGVMDWRAIQPEQIKANTDFICESSSRESNKAVYVNQMLKMIELSMGVMKAGTPVRLDKMLQSIGETGFTLKRDQMLEWFPAMKLEEAGMLDMDQLIVQASLSQFMMAAMGPQMMAQQQTQGGNGRPGQQQQPMNQGEAVANTNRENQVNLRT